MMYIDNQGNIIDRTGEIYTLLDEITDHLLNLPKKNAQRGLSRICTLSR